MKQTTKSLNLPKQIAAYFTADKGDSETLSQCFTENAVVRDEGHTYKGRAAIKEWKTDASAKYEYTCEPFACEERDGKTVVTSHLVGNLPGSPVDLRFLFKLEGTRLRRWKSYHEGRPAARTFSASRPATMKPRPA